MNVEIQGHRGDRGNFPENTIPAFLSAIKKGVDVIEMDVVISKDHQVVVSHEPFMSSLYMLQPNGEPISKENEKDFNLFQMNYDSIKQFDSGSKGNKKFLQQKKMKTYKPLLTEVIDTVEAFIKKEKIPAVKYNIEIKSEAKEYGKSQPSPKDFVALVTEVLKNKQVQHRVILQSFDVNILEEIHLHFSDFKLAYLVETGNYEQNKSLLSFQPDIYSPFYPLLSHKSMVEEIQQENIAVIPWTVNKKQAILKMLDFKVNGIITDYPERAITSLKSHK